MLFVKVTLTHGFVLYHVTALSMVKAFLRHKALKKQNYVTFIVFSFARALNYGSIGSILAHELTHGE